MSDKANDKVAQAIDKNAVQINRVIPTQFEYADFKMRCSCGHIHTIDTQVQGMLRFDMHTTDMHNMLLQCPACGHELELYFTEAEAPTDLLDPTVEDKEGERASAMAAEAANMIEDEPVQEESKN